MKLGLGLPNKAMNMCEKDRSGRDEKESEFSLWSFSSSIVIYCEFFRRE